ncbi:MAG: 2-oxo acid dehydrogenase subunit E2 [Ruminococcaceae bacterium]|nr:2-oxo acid dehydrogenase subunit E2 [Oscillospiraceae bacterium]
MRADGKKIKNIEPMYKVGAHIMNKRNDALNMIELDIPVEPMKKYLNMRRKEGYTFSHLSLFLAAYVRMLAEFPELNRFVVNKKIYARNEIAIGMVVLKPGETDGTMNKMYFEPTDDIFEVERKLNEYVEQNRGAGDTNSTDKLVSVLLSIPGLCTVAVGLFKLMDRYGLLPKSIIKASPFHASMTISNLASIRTNHIFHHVYNFGTTSMIITMGNMREVPMRKAGKVDFVRCMPIGVVMDERICTGSFYALAFRRMSEYLSDPSKLEGPPAVVNVDR